MSDPTANPARGAFGAKFLETPGSQELFRGGAISSSGPSTSYEWTLFDAMPSLQVVHHAASQVLVADALIG